MSEEKNMKQALTTYNTLCRMLDTRDWKYEKHEEDLLIKSGIQGEDLPIEFVMRVSPKTLLVSFISWLPFKIPEDKRIDAAVAVAVANYGLQNGSFDYDMSDGEIMFRLVSSFRESILGEDLFEYMILYSANVVDDYNDKLFMLSKGMITIEQFIQNEKSDS